ncbi:Connectin [Brachionus plicatilis]|uniref:Connectin n=1 Tax=Brachionus plicatilis TaxID=10195 RepID=A0A3M7PXX9_BRAPC|nr:Connectin [Brachionus plicatilis]
MQQKSNPAKLLKFEVELIDLSDNHFTEIERDTFINCENLKRLFLPHNSINFLHDNAFNGLGNVQTLKLKTTIFYLGKSIFQPLKNIQNLYLSQNIIA